MSARDRYQGAEEAGQEQVCNYPVALWFAARSEVGHVAAALSHLTRQEGSNIRHSFMARIRATSSCDV